METSQIRLSPKQYQIVEMICRRALRNKEISKELNTTEQCVKNHLKGVLDKTDLRDRVALCVWYYNGGRERIFTMSIKKVDTVSEPTTVSKVITVSEVTAGPIVSAAEILRRQAL